MAPPAEKVVVSRSSRVQRKTPSILLPSTHTPPPVARRNSVAPFLFAFAHLLIAPTDGTGKGSSVADTIEAHLSALLLISARIRCQRRSHACVRDPLLQSAFTLTLFRILLFLDATQISITVELRLAARVEKRVDHLR